MSLDGVSVRISTGSVSVSACRSGRDGVSAWRALAGLARSDHNGGDGSINH